MTLRIELPPEPGPRCCTPDGAPGATMTLRIELPPELEHQLEEQAARHGQAPAE